MSTRIRGTGLALVIDGVDYWADAVAVVLDHEDREVPAQDLGGPAQVLRVPGLWFFDVTAIQSTDPTSLWSLLWRYERREAIFTYSPHGNEVPTPQEPHFTGAVWLDSPPALGGEAGKDVEYVFTKRLYLPDGKPERVDHPGEPQP